MIRVLVQRYLTATGQLTNRLTLGLTLQNPAYASGGEYGFVHVHHFDKSNFKARLWNRNSQLELLYCRVGAFPLVLLVTLFNR